MSEEKINNSVMKCCICNNEHYGEFIIIEEKKYHLCCIENLQQENQQLKEELQKADSITQSCILEGGRSSGKTFRESLNLVKQYRDVLDEIRKNLQKSIDSINDKLSDKEIRVENGMIVNPINDYRVVRLKAIRMKCKELLQILDKVKE